ncbi:MAG TPA: M23 family metallopeptidase, partial [Candidatus Paceibacterota bacterium]
WLLTNEIGGYECMGAGGSALWPDVAHTDSGVGNYYSIDISWVNKNENNQPSQYGQYNTPVLAAAGGVVAFAGGTDGNTEADHDPNGFYIVIDHDYAQDPKIGFTTRYLHLKELPRRANGTLLHVGDTVNQGDQIGTVGSTGWYFDSATGTYKRSSTAEHLHFGVRYQDHGYSSIPELSKVVMEGLILKSYQTECSVNTSGVPTGRIRYYDSTNVPTGN